MKILYTFFNDSADVIKYCTRVVLKDISLDDAIDMILLGAREGENVRFEIVDTEGPTFSVKEYADGVLTNLS